MKILHVIDSGGLYGAEVMLLNLVDGQVRSGMDPSILSIGDIGVIEKPLEKEARKRGYRVWSVRLRRGPNFVGALKIVAAARRDGFDVIHTHGYKGNILFGFMPKRIRGMPVVATLHGWTVTEGLSILRLYEWLDAVSLRFVDAVVLVHQEMLAGKRNGILKGIKLRVVNNGIVAEDHPLVAGGTKDLDEAIVEFCKGGYIIGSIGRLSAEKGYRTLVQALGRFSKEVGDARILIIGEGSERKALENLVKELGLFEKVMLPGYRKDARSYLPFFNVFVLPSLTEGLPITILEAMNVGIPIISTRVGGVPEVLGYGKGGLLVDKNNAQEIAEGILKVQREPELGRSLGEWAQAEVGKRYSSQQMVAGYNEIYRAVVRDLG